MMARPTKYNKTYDRQVYRLALLGATDQELADFFEVNVDTIYEWAKVHPSFSEARKKGKMLADAAVTDRLYQRAIGYSHPAVKIFNDGGKPLIVDYVEHYPPDPTSCIFWLKNRQPQKWRDRIDQVHQGPTGGPVEIVRIENVIVDPQG
jgi:hypothetical protein